MTFNHAECYYAEFSPLFDVMLSAIMLSAIMLSVVMLKVVAPFCYTIESHKEKEKNLIKATISQQLYFDRSRHNYLIINFL